MRLRAMALLGTVMALLVLQVGAAEARSRSRHPPAKHQAGVSRPRPVGRVAPIVAGSSKIKVDSSGQVITDDNP